MGFRDPALPVMDPVMGPVMETPLSMAPDHWRKVASPHISNWNGEGATPHGVLVTFKKPRFFSDGVANSIR